MQSVLIKIKDTERRIEIPFQPDMNVQEALEKAADQEQNAGRKLSFAIQYFGYSQSEYLGYLVVMIDDQYDNPKDNRDYWWYRINGVDATVGIDNRMVNAGDEIEFDYYPADTLPSNNHLLIAKDKFYTSLAN